MAQECVDWKREKRENLKICRVLLWFGQGHEHSSYSVRNHTCKKMQSVIVIWVRFLKTKIQHIAQSDDIVCACVCVCVLLWLYLGMAMGRVYLSHPHILLQNTYLLPYPCPTGMRYWISSPSSTGLGIPTPSPQIIIFFNKKLTIFRSRAQCCNALSNKEMKTIDVYGDGVGRDWGCEIWKENLEKRRSSKRLGLWLCEWNDLEFKFLFI